MWPFTKQPNLPRVLMTSDWRGADKDIDTEVRFVQRVGELFVVKDYGSYRDPIEGHVIVLRPQGVVEGRPHRAWRKIDDIPGLTDASSAPAEAKQ